MAKKKTEAAAGRARRSDFKGLKPVLVRLEGRQDAALTREALKRAKKRGSARPDKSELVREAIDRHPDLKKT